jgi:membrane fusion protein (multidrug efflux system)
MKTVKSKSCAFMKKRVILTVALLAVITGAGSLWVYSQFYLQTDDAYVNANVVQLAPRISGQVVNLYIEDNQHVKLGQLLFEIDPVSFKVAVDKARAAVDRAQATVKLARMTADRINILTKDRVRSLQDRDQATATLQKATASLQQTRADLAAHMLNLDYTKITSPVSGWVTLLKLRAGNIVEASKPLFALVDQNEFWVDANFRETELKYVTLGQEADIEIDVYPGHHFKGVVDSISRGSGTAFSLLPPQNATGNWVKVTQRVPVKIRVVDVDSRFPLRIGTTATVTIKLKPFRSFRHNVSHG